MEAISWCTRVRRPQRPLKFKPSAGGLCGCQRDPYLIPTRDRSDSSLRIDVVKSSSYHLNRAEKSGGDTPCYLLAVDGMNLFSGLIRNTDQGAVAGERDEHDTVIIWQAWTWSGVEGAVSSQRIGLETALPASGV